MNGVREVRNPPPHSIPFHSIPSSVWNLWNPPLLWSGVWPTLSLSYFFVYVIAFVDGGREGFSGYLLSIHFFLNLPGRVANRMNIFDWAIAAVCVIDAHDRPLYTDVFFSREEVLQLSAPTVQGNLVVSREDELHLQFLMHAALDVCHERASSRYLSTSVSGGSMSPPHHYPSSDSSPPPASSLGRTSGAADVRFLDRVLEEGSRCVHGFQSASGIRVLLVTIGEAPRDAVLPLCRSVYELASSALCAPFRSFVSDSLHTSRKFVTGLQATVGPFTATSRSGRCP